MFFLAWRNLRTRRGLFGGSFAALAFGIAILAILANLVAASVSQRPVNARPTRYEAAPVLIQALQTVTVQQPDNASASQEKTAVERRQLAAIIAEKAQTVAGVNQTIIDRSFTASIIDRKLVVDPGSYQTGHNWSAALLTPFSLQHGTAPDDHSVVLAQGFADRNGLRVGDAVRIATPQKVDTFRIAGIVAPPRASGVPKEDTIFFSDARAAQLTANTQLVDAIGVFPATQVSEGQLAQQLTASLKNYPELEVVHGVNKGGNVALQAYDTGVAELEAFLGLLIFITAFVCIFVVYGTSAFAIGQRRQELALLRLIGAAPRRIRRMVLQEAVIVALLAGIAGSAIGSLSTAPFLKLLQHHDLAPASVHAIVSPLALLVASLIGMTVALLGIYTGARRSGQVSPAEALREASTETKSMTRWRWIFGSIFAVVSVLLLAVIPRIQGAAAVPLALLTTETIVIALVLFIPAFLKTVVWIAATPLIRLVPKVGELVRANITASKRQTATLVAPIMIAVSLTGALLGVGNTMSAANRLDAEHRVNADYIMATADGPGVPVDTAARVKNLRGVNRAAYVIPTNVRLYSNWEISKPTGAITRTMLKDNFNLTVRQGSLHNFSGNAVVMAEDVAQDIGKNIGSTIEVILPDGTKTTLHVAALLATTAGLPDFLVTPELVHGHIHDPFVTNMYIQTSDHQIPPELSSFTNQYGLQIMPKQAWLAAQTEAAARSNNTILLLLLGLALLYLAISIANTLLMAINGRTKEFMLLRKIGASQANVRTMVAWETLFVVILGAVLGMLAACATIFSVYAVLLRSIPGAPVAVPWMAWLLLIGVTLGIAFLSSVMPTTLRLRHRNFLHSIPRE